MTSAVPDHIAQDLAYCFETPELLDAEVEAMKYVNEVLQKQDITIVESVHRGMSTPSSSHGRHVCDPGSGLSEHRVHHFLGPVLTACASLVDLYPSVPTGVAVGEMREVAG